MPARIVLEREQRLSHSSFEDIKTNQLRKPAAKRTERQSARFLVEDVGGGGEGGEE